MEEWPWLKNLSPELQNIIMIVSGISPIVVLIVYFFYAGNLAGLLKAMRPGNRKVVPGKVWLLLLGFLNYGIDILVTAVALPYTWTIVLKYLVLGGASLWQVYISLKISESVKSEFNSRGIAVEEAPTWKWAVNYCLSMLVQIPVYLHSTNPDHLLMAWLWVMVSWIAYWVETAKYKKRLQALPAPADEESLVFKNLN